MEYIISKLKEIKHHNGRINPDRSWVASNKDRLMTQIGNTVETEEKVHFNMNTIWQGLQIILPGRLAYSVARPLVVFLLIFTIAASGWITTVGATQNALPGDFSYGVKVAVSKVTKDNIDVARGIANDVKKVAVKQEKDAPQKVATGVEILKKTLDSANEDIKKASDKKPEEAVEQAKKMSDNVKEINADLKEIKKEMEKVVEVVGENEGVLQDTKEKVDEVKNLATKSAQEAVEEVVKKQVEGEIKIDEAEVKELVEGHIKIVLEGADDITEEAGDVVILVASSTLSVVSSTPAILATSSTPEILATTSTKTIKDIVDETAKKVTETGESAKQNLEEAKELVESNQLLEALEKVKEVSEATEESEDAVKEVKKVVKEAEEEAEEILKQVQDDIEVGENIQENVLEEVVNTTNTEDIIEVVEENIEVEEVIE